MLQYQHKHKGKYMKKISKKIKKDYKRPLFFSLIFAVIGVVIISLANAQTTSFTGKLSQKAYARSYDVTAAQASNLHIELKDAGKRNSDGVRYNFVLVDKVTNQAITSKFANSARESIIVDIPVAASTYYITVGTLDTSLLTGLGASYVLTADVTPL